MKSRGVNYLELKQLAIDLCAVWDNSAVYIYLTIYYLIVYFNGAITQLGECFNCMEEVMGSNPISPTKYLKIELSLRK